MITDIEFLTSLLAKVPSSDVPRLEEIIRKVDVDISVPTANVTLLLSRSPNGSYKKVPLAMNDTLSLVSRVASPDTGRALKTNTNDWGHP